MNHGGIGYLNHRRLVLPVDLLRPLSIGDKSRVVALHYPRGTTPDYADAPNGHDLVITPVPLRYWSVMGRLLVRLRHVQGAMAEVAEWLRDREISILNAECSRSAHRYATWNLTIAFDGLIGKTNPFDPATSEHRATRSAVRRLGRDLSKTFTSDILFRDPNDPSLSSPVEGVPVRTHSYFHNYMNRADGPSRPRPFELYCSHSQLQSVDERLAALLDTLSVNGSELVPTCVIAEMDTRDFNIRVAIIPPEDLHRFFEVVIPYRRSGGQSTRGLIATITRTLSPRYNIWRLFNSTSQNGKDVEAGQTILCVEDCKRGNQGMIERKNALEGVVGGIRRAMDRDGPSGTKILPHVHVDPITPTAVRARLTRQRVMETGTEYDVFISYGKKDGRQSAHAVRNTLERHGIRTHLDEAELRSGDDWHLKLMEGIRLSGEVAVVCTKASLNRPWIALEIGCALGLGKSVTPILCGGLVVTDVPEYLKRFQCVDRKHDPHLETYCGEVLQRVARAARF